jgi:hypothetical protein
MQLDHRGQAAVFAKDLLEFVSVCLLGRVTDQAFEFIESLLHRHESVGQSTLDRFFKELCGILLCGTHRSTLCD